ncbi:hypothetical protein JIN84_04995 [Luteolibacter yonseiensis]|uniref:Uncharacterized protein n=1 Tax=Luteolibacter yonseiensis TaxID=1144680 RepID=A0A934R469_9BACT|nr:hypothetical protein [Luteolibacter yonseiensis]MBK1814960.1 hypothetical protein [Luteolibacter yonseiensis]
MKQRLTQETRELTGEESSMAEDQRTEKSLVFDSVEAMIRHDAANTVVPPDLKNRVMRSVAREPGENTSKPWWKRWMPF